MWISRSLTGRVALSVAFGSLVSASVVAVVSGVLSSRLARTQEDGALRDAAGMLAFALQVKHHDAERAAADQTGELAHAGIAVAVFEQRRLVAGDSAIEFVAPGSCADVSRARVCAVPAGHFVAAAARDHTRTREQQDVSAHAAILAVIFTMLVSTGLALALAYAAVKPLITFASTVQRIPSDGGADAELGADEGVREVDALRAALRSAFDRLGRALDQANHFAGHAAAQLKMPLTSIIGELDHSLEIAGENGRDERQRARRVAARLFTLVERLWILAGPDERAVRAAPELSLRAVVEDALETLPEPARCRITCHEAAPIKLRADPALLVSAIVSALENSLKFSDGDVRAIIEARGEQALLAIEDDGPGILEREREQVFAPFYRGQQGRTGQYAGHGIGLAIISRVTSAHGGTARFVERARGARLEMTFARLDIADDGLARPPKAPLPNPNGGKTGSKRM